VEVQKRSDQGGGGPRTAVAGGCRLWRVVCRRRPLVSVQWSQDANPQRGRNPNKFAQVIMHTVIWPAHHTLMSHQLYLPCLTQPAFGWIHYEHDTILDLG
jgi:hypothetical protein